MTVHVEAENRRTLQLFQAAWVKGDLDTLLELVTDDVVFSGSVGPEPGRTFRGREDVGRGFHSFLSSDVGYCLTEEPLVMGDDAYARWTWYRSEDDTNRPISVGIDHFRFRDGKICLKDAYRKVLSRQSHPMRPAPGNTTPGLDSYQKRYYRFCGVETFGAIAVKAYKIGTDKALDESLDDSLIAALKDLADEVAGTEAQHGLAYAIIHEGTAGTWLLFHWWAYGEINCQIVLRRLTQGGEFIRKQDPYLSACVWESVVIEHERVAWVSNMLRNQPCRRDYLADVLADGQY